MKLYEDMEPKGHSYLKAEHFFVHPAISEQVSARQPPLWLVALLYISPFWLLSSIFRILQFSFPAFSQSYADHPEIYRSVYFVVQAAIICGIVIGCSVRFRAALWSSHTVRRNTKWELFFIFIPVFCLYSVWTGLRFGALYKALSSQDVSIYQIHDYYWAGALYGPSFNGVILTSTMVVCISVFEEVIFNGFLVNLLSRRFGVGCAVVTVPVIFTICHIPREGWGLHLVPILIFGLTAILIRLASGKLIYTVIGHVVVNGIFLLPMWAEAYFFYNSH